MSLLSMRKFMGDYLEVDERDSLEGASLKSAAGIGCKFTFSLPLEAQ